MTAKSLGIKMPAASDRAADQDAYLNQRAPVATDPVENRTRLTIEIPASLHRRIKHGCVDRNTTIKEAILKALEVQFANW